MKKILVLSLALFLSIHAYTQDKKVEEPKKTPTPVAPAEEKPEYVFKGTVKDVISKKKVYDATVTLKGSDGSVEVVKTGKNGKYIFDKKLPSHEPYIKPNTNYTVEVKKEGYKTASSQESTEGNDQETFVLDFLLERETE